MVYPYLYGTLISENGFLAGRGVDSDEDRRTGARIVKAKVPLAETFGYVTALRTITSGRATSSMEFSHYAEVSSSIAKEVVAEFKGRTELL